MFSLQQLLKFYLTATPVRKIASPYFKNLLEEVLDKERIYYSFSSIERLKNQLLLDASTIEVHDLGAGSRKKAGLYRTIQSIAKTAVSSSAQCAQLFRLVHFLQAKNRLEIGSSLGISSLYQYFPIRNSNMYSLEGCPNIAQIAQSTFDKLAANNLELIVGNFANTLLPTLKKMQSLDYVFIDGNHRLEATLSYFETCLPFCHAKSVMVLDDIHWSKEMQQAWARIRKHPKVALSIDLYHMGWVFFDANDSPQKQLNILFNPFD